MGLSNAFSSTSTGTYPVGRQQRFGMLNEVDVPGRIC